MIYLCSLLYSDFSFRHERPQQHLIPSVARSASGEAARHSLNRGGRQRWTVSKRGRLRRDGVSLSGVGANPQ